MAVVELRNIGVEFKKVTGSVRPQAIKRSLTSIFKKKTKVERFWALNNISFTLCKGDSFGIIGNNGAGKSTLLKVLTGVLIPDKGYVNVNGNVSALLSSGAGFHPDLSGRENVYLNAIFLGLTKKEVDEIYDEIVSFAELEDFIHTQLRYYSSGMRARLGFSVAVHVKTDILIVDEVLGSGDKDFRKKAEKKMEQFMRQAKAIVIVSHNTDLITNLCNKFLWLEKGEKKDFGSSADIVHTYVNSEP